MSPADQSLVRHVERVRHQRLVDWGVRPGPTKRSRLFGLAYAYGGHVLGLSIFAAALLLCGY
jgi:hypothetical protein